MKMASLFYSVHIAGLPHSINETTLKDLFMDAGDVKTVFIAREKNYIDPKRHPCTYGFATKGECDKAMELFDNWPMGSNHTLDVNMSHTRKPCSVDEKTSPRRPIDKNVDPRALEALDESLSRLGLQGGRASLLMDLSRAEYKPVQNWTYPQEDISVNLKYLDSLTQQIEEIEKKNLNTVKETNTYSETYSKDTERQDGDPVFLGLNSGIQTNTGDSEESPGTANKPVHLGRGRRPDHVTHSDRETKSAESKRPPVPIGRGRAMLEKYKQLC